MDHEDRYDNGSHHIRAARRDLQKKDPGKLRQMCRLMFIIIDSV